MKAKGIQPHSEKWKSRDKPAEEFKEFTNQRDTIVLREGSGSLLIGHKEHRIQAPGNPTPQEFLDELVRAEKITQTPQTNSYEDRYTSGLYGVMHGRPARHESVIGNEVVTVYRQLATDKVVAMVRDDNYYRSDLGIHWKDHEVAIKVDLLEGKQIKTRRVIGKVRLPARRPKQKWWR